MPDNRPRARQKNVTSGGGNAERRGSGLGTGPVGAGANGGYNGKGGGGGGGKRAIGGVSLPIIVIIVIYFLLSNRGGGTDSGYSSYDDTSTYTNTAEQGYNTGSQSSDIYTSANYTTQSFTDTSSGESADTSVSSGAREKYTEIYGDGSDKVTLMVYMCGTDLESRSGMASNDLAEMASARLSDNVNIIVYTGGCTGWKTRGISSSVNQIYQIKNGGLNRLVEDDGAKPMTDPATLSGFIKYCAANFPANRNELIFWDHGGGSISGYGYDEKYKSSGSMSLTGIKKALTDGGVKFDFIGFDACLMATAETAIMLDEFGDYMIASEETEPGIGWYYTNWLTKLSNNTSTSTLEIGKNIIDDFTAACAQKCRGQKTTLSIIDLAEFSDTVPDKLTDFSKSVNSLIVNNDYKTVSDARYETREFATSSRIDQVDLADLAENMNTGEGRALADAIKKAVKYNRVSQGMTNAYGVSIYFPYNKKSYVDKAVTTYEAIGMDSEYAKCIKEAAAMQTSGQVAAGGTFDPFSLLLGGGASSSGSGYGSGSADMVGSLLTAFLSNRSSIAELDESNTEFYTDRSMSVEDTAEYISMNHLDANNLFWNSEGGKWKLVLPESQWELVHDIDLNMFYDDGEGYIDLGLDNIFEYDESGNLVADTSGTWLAINGQIVPYYHTDTIEKGNDEYVITGYVPVRLNGEGAKLIIVFDNENPYGYIAGAVSDYKDGETEVIAKNMTALNAGDKLDFVCDYYSYDNVYQDSYFIGEQMTVTDNMEIGDAKIGSGQKMITYRLTDIYNQAYWTPAIEAE